jgi:iron(III) transport system substrate-binding protein
MERCTGTVPDDWKGMHMRRTPRLALRLPLLATAVLLTAGLAACGGEAGGGEAGAGGQTDAGKLLVYSGRQEQLVKPLIQQFQQQTGIEVSVRYGSTPQLAAQLLEEGDRTDADVYFSQDGGALGALSKAGRLEPLPQETLDKVPAQYRARDGSWVGTSGRARVIVYDPRQLRQQDVPDSVFALTDPKWKGKIGISPSNASFQAFVTAMRVLKGDDATRRWLAGIKANQPQLFDNNVAILNAVNNGTVTLGLINHYYWYEQVAENGIQRVPARLKFLPGGDPGALVNVAGAGVLRGSGQSSEAQRFVAFLLSPDAQRFFSDRLKEYPLVAGVPLPRGLLPLDRLQAPDIDLSDLDTLEQTLQMIEQAGLT